MPERHLTCQDEYNWCYSEFWTTVGWVSTCGFAEVQEIIWCPFRAAVLILASLGYPLDRMVERATEASHG